MRKEKEIEYMLGEIYDNIGIDKPENHNEIVKFITNDVEETTDPEGWHDGDVIIAFRRYLESKTQ